MSQGPHFASDAPVAELLTKMVKRDQDHMATMLETATWLPPWVPRCLNIAPIVSTRARQQHLVQDEFGGSITPLDDK